MTKTTIYLIAFLLMISFALQKLNNKKKELLKNPEKKTEEEHTEEEHTEEENSEEGNSLEHNEDSSIQIDGGVIKEKIYEPLIITRNQMRKYFINSKKNTN